MPNATLNSLEHDKKWSFSDTTRMESSYLTHGYHRYPAKFIPNIVQKLINDYTKPGNLIVDPFGGCGTTLVEAKISGRKSIGVDINPIAKLITDIKTKPIDPKKLKKFHSAFLEIYNKTPDSVPNFKTDRLDYWFEKETQIKLNRIYISIKSIKDPYIRKFYFVAFSHILKNCSKWLMKSIKPQIDKTKNPKDPFSIFSLHIKFMMKRNLEFYNLLKTNGFLNLDCKMKIANTAKKVPIKSGSVDFIVTSPPYVTSYEYADLHQLSLLWFGSDEKYFKSWGKLVGDFNGFKKQFIGTSFSKEVDVSELNSETAKEIIKNLELKDRGEALNVAGYYLDINKSFKEIYRILKPNSKACVIVGNTSLKDVEILNAQVVLEQLENLGFKKLEIIKREIGTKIITSWRDKQTGRFSSSESPNSKRVYQYEYLLIVSKMTREKNYQLQAKIFKWTGKGAWFFIRIEKETAENIRDNFGMYAKGWGSLPVNVTLGNSTWKTSIFPDKGTYLLPIKSQIRKAENIKETDTLNINLEISIESTEIPAPPITG